MWTYRLEYVRCGKRTCRTCPHGPYWYRYQKRRDGSLRKEYVGRARWEDFESGWEDWNSDERRRAATDDRFGRVRPEQPESADRWIWAGRMTRRAALRIFGLGDGDRLDAAALKRRYWSLMREHHPDKGGEARVCGAINAAYDFLSGD